MLFWGLICVLIFSLSKLFDGLIYTNSNPCINTTPGMNGDIVGWYQINKMGELEK